MTSSTTTPLPASWTNCLDINLSPLRSRSSISPRFINFPVGSSAKGMRLKKLGRKQIITKAVNEDEEFSNSPPPLPSPPPSPSKGEKPPLKKLPSGRKVYPDEHKIYTFLESSSDHHTPQNAQWLWKEIAEIPGERRYRLLHLLDQGLVRAAWHIAGARYELQELAELSSSSLLSGEHDTGAVELWSCRKTGGSMPFALVNYLKKALFRKDGNLYGRLIGNSLLGLVATTLKPLYFTVKDVKQVIPTEEPCDLAYDFGDGLVDLKEYPEGFPKPAKHPWPFNDRTVIYVRHVGPGVTIGQAWHEGRDPEQMPEKLCNEILMVKDRLSVL